MKIFNRRPFFSLLIPCCFFAIFTLLKSPQAAGGGQNGLRGPAFTDPMQVMEMGEDWEKQSITYESWAAGADLAVSLDQHLYLIFAPVIKQYAREHGLKIAVQEGTCGVSANLLAARAVDIAAFCCPPGELDRLPGLQYHTAGITGLTILVHPDNPVNNITFEQARKIYQGKIRNWSELQTDDGRPGPDRTIQAIARLHCKLRPGHWRPLLDNEDLFSPRLYLVGSIEDVMGKVASNRWAIGGFESLYMAYERYPQKIRPKTLKIDGYFPGDSDQLAAGNLPLYFSFNLTTWEGGKGGSLQARRLVDYLLQASNNIGKKFNIVPAARLRTAGWRFHGNELVGEP